jgi:hypothetical protein
MGIDVENEGGRGQWGHCISESLAGFGLKSKTKSLKGFRFGFEPNPTFKHQKCKSSKTVLSPKVQSRF